MFGEVRSNLTCAYFSDGLVQPPPSFCCKWPSDPAVHEFFLMTIRMFGGDFLYTQTSGFADISIFPTVTWLFSTHCGYLDSRCEFMFTVYLIFHVVKFLCYNQKSIFAGLCQLFPGSMQREAASYELSELWVEPTRNKIRRWPLEWFWMHRHSM